MFRGEAEGEPVTGSQVEADVVAEVVKDVIPSGFSLNLIISLNRYSEIIFKIILSYVGFFPFQLLHQEKKRRLIPFCRSFKANVNDTDCARKNLKQ